ncbi:MAG: hypothetical protein ACKVI4_17675, partial [Actinomycetales bacterium]
LGPERAERLLARAAAAATAAGVGVSLMRSSGLAHVQRPLPPSLRLVAHAQLELASLPEAVAALASALEGELRRGERDVDAARAGV